MKVGRYDYAAQLEGELDSVLERIRGMLVDGRYVLGAEVAGFEAAFARYLGARAAVGVNCGTDALVLALRGLGIGPGDEVITQANTFNATVTAIVLAGATPVLVDADESSYLMDVDQVAAAVTSRTRALMPVHLYGKPVPIDGLLDLARRHGLEVIEDAAQAHGARWRGRRVGTFGAAAAFSFHPSKNLAAAGDGGAVVTDDPDLAVRLSQLRNLGQREPNEHLWVGLNSKLDAVQAVILEAKLRHLDQWNAQRRQVAQWYRDALADEPVSFQETGPDEEHVFHLFQMRTPRRDALLATLRGAGIDVTVRYPEPIHRQPCFAGFGWLPGQFPVAERLAGSLICLPIRPDLTVDEVAVVADAIHEFHRR